MTRHIHPIHLALTALALLGLAHLCPAQAQEIPKGRVAFKATAKTGYTLFWVTGTGSISDSGSGPGEATPLGQITFAHTGQADFDYDPAAGLDRFLFGRGEASFTAANGDAIFVKRQTFPGSSPDPKLIVVQGAWLVTGGTGRFVGARGSGTMRMEIAIGTDTTPDQSTHVYEGTITAPKP